MLKIDVTDTRQTVTAEDFDEYVRAKAELLSAAQKGEPQYQDSLGWLHVDEWAGSEVLSEIDKMAAKICAEAEVFVLVGVGGSNNAARAVIEAIRPTVGPEIIYAGNTLSAYEMKQVLAMLEGKSVYIDCIAKNFETLEPGVTFRIMRQYLEQRYGRQAAKKRILCTGTPGASLEALCSREGYAFLPFPPNIGGRFTALSYVHLLPMAVLGINIRALVQGAADMEKQLRTQPAGDNPAMQYAALRNCYWKKGYRIEMLSTFEPRLRWFGNWWEQLYGESEGKDGKGLFPVCGEFSEELHSLGQYIQQGTPMLFETFIDVCRQQESLKIEADDVDDGFEYLNGKDLWAVNKAAFTATRNAHSQVLPCITLEVDALDAYHYGQLFYFFQFSCYLSGRMLGVNPFDQPGVEAYKDQMFKILGK